MIRISIICTLLFGCGRLYAQDARQQLIENAVLEYLRVAGNQAIIYYGDEQEGYPRTSNHPYLKNAQHAKSRLLYHRILYPEALLRLDLHRDELVIQSPEFRNFVLSPENFEYAELHGQHIIYFRRDSLPGCPSTGYYILLYSGNCMVLEKQIATLLRNNQSTTLDQYYALTTNFYLYKDGVYHTIRNKRGLLNVLHPYKKELKQFISSHRWRFRHDAEELIAQTVGEYEKLSGL